MAANRISAMLSDDQEPNITEEYLGDDDTQSNVEQGTIREKKKHRGALRSLKTLSQGIVGAVTLRGKPKEMIALQQRASGFVIYNGDEEEDESDGEMDDDSSKAVIRNTKELRQHEKWMELAEKHVSSLDIEDEDNALKAIPNDIQALNELKTFTLKWSPVKTLNSCLFSMPLTNLSVVKCSLHSIDGVQRIRGLQVLEVTSCKLEALPSDIGILSELESLDVTGNKLKSLPLSIGDLRSLKILSCGANALSSLPVSIGGLDQLTALDASKNRIQELPDTIGDISTLTTLRMSNNKLSVLPVNFERLQNLHFLFLGHNRFCEVPGVLKSSVALNSLNMHANQITTMREPLPQLMNLILDENRIKKLPEELFACTSLELLNLSSNKLDTIPDKLCQLKKLKVLYLGDNDIRELPLGLAGLKELRHLCINQTKIKDLPDDFASLAKLNVFDFSDSLIGFELRTAFKYDGVKGVRDTILERRKSHAREIIEPDSPRDESPNPDIFRNHNLSPDKRRVIVTMDFKDRCSTCERPPMRSDLAAVNERASTSTTGSGSSRDSEETPVTQKVELDGRDMEPTKTSTAARDVVDERLPASKSTTFEEVAPSSEITMDNNLPQFFFQGQKHRSEKDGCAKVDKDKDYVNVNTSKKSDGAETVRNINDAQTREKPSSVSPISQKTGRGGTGRTINNVQIGETSFSVSPNSTRHRFDESGSPGKKEEEAADGSRKPRNSPVVSQKKTGENGSKSIPDRDSTTPEIKRSAGMDSSSDPQRKSRPPSAGPKPNVAVKPVLSMKPITAHNGENPSISRAKPLTDTALKSTATNDHERDSVNSPAAFKPKPAPKPTSRNSSVTAEGGEHAEASTAGKTRVSNLSAMFAER